MPTRTWQFRSEGADGVIRDHERIRQSEERLGRSRARGGSADGYPTQGPAQDRMRGTRQRDGVRSEERMQRIRDSIRDASLRKEQQMLDRAEAAKTRLAERHQRTRDRIRDASLARDQRESEKAERAKLIARKRMWGSFEGPTMAGAGRTLYGIGGAAISAGIAAGAFGVGVAGAAVRNREAARGQAVALSVAGRGAGQTAVDPNQLLGDATKTALGIRGTKTSDVLSSMQRYVQMTGDLEGARANAGTFATAARATGSTEEEIAATAATMREKFGIKDPGEMRQALARMTFQGKSGAFEMKDASQFFTEIGAAGQRFGLDKGVEGVSTLGGLAQLAMKSAGSGAKASTGVQAMLRQLVAKSSDIKSMTGTDVFTDATKTKTRNVQDVLVGMVSGAGGNQQKLQKILGDEGMVGASALISAFNEAANATKKGATETERRAAGEAAMRRVLDESIKAGGDWSEVQKDAAAATDTASARLTTSWETIAAQAGDALLPALTKLAGALALGAPLMQAFGGMLAIAADDLGGFIKWLQTKGLLDKPAEPTEGDLSGKNDRIAFSANSEKIAAIKKGAAGRKMTPEEQKQLATLESEQSAIKERSVARDGSLSAPLTGPFLPGTEENIRFGLREDDFVNGVASNDNGYRGPGNPDPLGLLTPGGHTEFQSFDENERRLERVDRANDGDRFTAGRSRPQDYQSLGSGKEGTDALIAAARALQDSANQLKSAGTQFSTPVKGG